LTAHRSHTDSTIRRPRPPPVTGRLPCPLTPKRCTATLLKAPPPDSLMFPPPDRAKLRQSNDQTTRQRPGAWNRSPTSAWRPRRCHRTPGFPARRGRGGQDGRWGGVVGPDLRGLRPHCHSRRRISWPLRCWRPQGDHRRDQHRRNHQVDDQEHNAKRRYHGGLGSSTDTLPAVFPNTAAHRLARQSIANQRTGAHRQYGRTASLLLCSPRRPRGAKPQRQEHKASGTQSLNPSDRGWVAATGSSGIHRSVSGGVTLALLDRGCGHADFVPQVGWARVWRLDRLALAPRARPSTPVHIRFEAVEPWQPASSPSSWFCCWP